MSWIIPSCRSGLKINIIKVRGKETGQKHTLNVSLYSAHSKGNLPDKATGSKYRAWGHQSRNSTEAKWAASLFGQWPCQVCLWVQPSPLHLEGTEKERKFSMLLFRLLSPSSSSYLNPKYSFEIMFTKSTCQAYQPKWKWWLQYCSGPE